MTHGINAHETAAYMVQTGRKPGERDRLSRRVGAVVSLFKGYDAGYKGLIPPYIVLTEPQGRFSEAGFLGPRYKPFATGGDPAQSRFVVEGVVAQGISDERQREPPRTCSASSTRWRSAMPGDPSSRPLAQCEEQAYDLILGDAGKVFDLSQEKDELRDRYGRNTFGQSCLMARRLVERGVPYVTINYRGWDTHKQHFQTMRRKLPELDKGLATLLAGSGGPRPARQHHRLVGRRVRPHAEGPVGGALERRPQPLRQGVLGAWSPAAASRAARWSAPRTRRARRSRIARLSVRPDRQHVRAARHRPRRPTCRTRRARRCASTPAAGRGRADAAGG